jgi:hypothetical protein
VSVEGVLKFKLEGQLISINPFTLQVQEGIARDCIVAVHLELRRFNLRRLVLSDGALSDY